MNRSQRKRAAKREGSLVQQIENRIAYIRASFLEDLFEEDNGWTYQALFELYNERWSSFAKWMNEQKRGISVDARAFAREFEPLETLKTA